MIDSRRFCLLISIHFAGGCALSPYEQLEEIRFSGKPHAAAYIADGLTVDRNPPNRTYQKYEFFYKHCDLMGRTPFPKKAAEYECTDPY